MRYKNLLKKIDHCKYIIFFSISKEYKLKTISVDMSSITNEVSLVDSWFKKPLGQYYCDRRKGSCPDYSDDEWKKKPITPEDYENYKHLLKIGYHFGKDKRVINFFKYYLNIPGDKWFLQILEEKKALCYASYIYLALFFHCDLWEFTAPTIQEWDQYENMARNSIEVFVEQLFIQNQDEILPAWKLLQIGPNLINLLRNE
jgi:hypothetical protein